MAGELNLVILPSCDRRLDRILSPDCQRPIKVDFHRGKLYPRWQPRVEANQILVLPLAKSQRDKGTLPAGKKFLLFQHIRLHSDLLFV